MRLRNALAEEESRPCFAADNDHQKGSDNLIGFYLAIISHFLVSQRWGAPRSECDPTVGVRVHQSNGALKGRHLEHLQHVATTRDLRSVQKRKHFVITAHGSRKKERTTRSTVGARYLNTERVAQKARCNVISVNFKKAGSNTSLADTSSRRRRLIYRAGNTNHRHLSGTTEHFLS